MTSTRHNDSCSPSETALFCCIGGGAFASAAGCAATGARIYSGDIPYEQVLAAGGTSQTLAQGCCKTGIPASISGAVVGFCCNREINKCLEDVFEKQQAGANTPSPSVDASQWYATAPVPQTMGRSAN